MAVLLILGQIQSAIDSVQDTISDVETAFIAVSAGVRALALSDPKTATLTQTHG